MNKTLNNILKAALVVVLVGVVSCGDEKPPASQNQVVSKKIYTDQAKAKPAANTVVTKEKDVKAPDATSDGAKSEGAEAVTKVADSLSQKSEGTPLATDAKKTSGAVTPMTSDLIKASLELVSTYDAKGRIDPFKPLFSEAPVAQVSTGKKKKRAPQTPLEKVALNQLKLTAILRMPQGNRALVEDATGKGYVVKKGTYMGLNAGQVIKIDQDRVLVEEEIQNMVGEYIINNTELKLQKSAGDQ